MTEFTYDFQTVHRITADAVGAPGQRVFYVQARRGVQLISLLAEKEQVRALADAIERLLEELTERDPRLSTSDDLLITDMSLEEPLDPEFRIIQMGLGYDSDRDMMVLVVQGQPLEEPPATDFPEASADEETESEEFLVRLSATRVQMRALSTHASRVVAAGRPICGNCGQPMELSGHFCPERNGHGPVSSS